MDTREYEHLLDESGVVGVVVDDADEQLEIRVSDGRPKRDILPDGFECEYDITVVDEGFGEIKDGYDIEIAGGSQRIVYRQDRIRSVQAGVSEGHPDVTAGTAGPYVCRVTDTSKARWGKDVSEGDMVRLSNNHVYANVNHAELGDPITQPGRIDGGDTDGDTVGELVGYLPIEDGCRADVAARSARVEQDNPRAKGLPVTYGRNIHRGDPRELKGETVTNTGRTLGVRWADVQRVGASVRVNYGGDAGVITLRNQIITGDMSAGGQSGSAVYREKTGELCGILFAGGPSGTIFTHVTDIEDSFGVEFSPHGDTLSGSIDAGLSEGQALPTDRKTTVSCSVTHEGTQQIGLCGLTFAVGDGWEIVTNNGDGTLRQFESKEKDYVTYSDLKPGDTRRSDVTFKADSSVEPGGTTETVVEIANNGIVFEEKPVSLSVAPDIRSYYDPDGDGDIPYAAAREAMGDYRNGRITLREASKIISMFRE